MPAPVVRLLPPTPHVVPIPASDPLFVDTLRSGLEAYSRGDYRRAHERFGDAAAVGGYRPDAAAWAVLSVALEAILANGGLVSRDAAWLTDGDARV
jgi:hypothetical protein